MKIKKRTLISIGIVIGGLTLIAAVVIPLYVAPYFQQKNIENDINYRITEIYNKIGNGMYEDALDRVEKTYEEVYRLNSEYKKEYYHCSIKISEGVCYIRMGSNSDDEKNIVNGLEKEKEIFNMISVEDGRILHALAYYELGIGYWHLSEIQNPIDNMILSVESFEECIDITTVQDEGGIHYKAKNKLRIARLTLKAKIENLERKR